MTAVVHTFGQLPPRYRKAGRAIAGAVRTGLRNIGNKVERYATALLSGGGPAGAYPVPRRTGHLARSMGTEVGDRQVVVFDSAQYAAPIHNGFRPFGNPHAPRYPGRPFMADAVDKVDPVAELLQPLEAVL